MGKIGLGSHGKLFLNVHASDLPAFAGPGRKEQGRQAVKHHPFYTQTALQWMPFRPCCSEVAVKMCCGVWSRREAGNCLGPQQGMRMELPSWPGKQATSSPGYLRVWAEKGYPVGLTRVEGWENA